MIGVDWAFAAKEAPAAAADDLSSLWTVTANVSLVLGFALVAEVRAAARGWKYEARARRVASAAIYTFLGIVLVIVLNISLVALTGSKMPDWLPTTIINVLCIAGSVLIANPIVVVATAGNGDLFILAGAVGTRIRRRRVRRHFERQLRQVRRLRRRAAHHLRGWRIRVDALDSLDAGRALSPIQWRLLMKQLYRTKRLPKKTLRRIPQRWNLLGQYRVQLRNHFSTELNKSKRLFGKINAIYLGMPEFEKDMSERLAEIFGSDFEKEVKAYYDEARKTID